MPVNSIDKRSIETVGKLADIATFQLQKRAPEEPEYVDETGEDLIHHLANFQLQTRHREIR